MTRLKKEKQKEAKLLTRGVKHANLVNECFNYFCTWIFVYFLIKLMKLHFIERLMPSLWLVPVLLAYHSIVSILLKSKASTIENELEHGRTVLNKYVHVDPSN